MTAMRRALPLLLLLAFTPAHRAAPPADYADPEGTLALHIPDGWQVRREKADPLTSVEVAPPGDTVSPRLYILCLTSRSRISPEQLPDLAELLTKAGIVALRQDGQILSQSHTTTRFHGRDALRTDVQSRLGTITYTSQLTVVLGRTHAYLLAVASPANDPAGLKRAQAALATVALESAAPSEANGLWTAQALDRLVAAAHNAATTLDLATLVPGEPPLTAGAVRAWTRAAETAAHCHFTEAESLALETNITAAYRAAAPATREHIARDHPPTAATLNDFLQHESSQSWTQILPALAARRTEKIAAIKSARPSSAPATAANTLTRSALDASAEMLAFLWIAAGRKADALTPETVADLRDTIEYQFPRLPADTQYLFANAEPIYAGLRHAWKAASPDQRAAYAKSFANALDACGLTPAPTVPPFHPDNTRAANAATTLWPFATQ
jgi:hypothetical protein